MGYTAERTRHPLPRGRRQFSDSRQGPAACTQTQRGGDGMLGTLFERSGQGQDTRLVDAPQQAYLLDPHLSVCEGASLVEDEMISPGQRLDGMPAGHQHADASQGIGRHGERHRCREGQGARAAHHQHGDKHPIALLDFDQAEAYSRRFAFMHPVTLPRGVVDLGRDMPPRNIHLVAATGSLVARDSTHPALIQLFVQAAAQVHGGPGWFQQKGEFPNARNSEWPLAAEAERFYRSGVPFLQRYLPFWLANLFERMWPVLVTLIAVLLPLSRMLPPLYEFRVRSRIFRWYGQLRALEAEVGTRDAAEIGDGLDALERRVERIAVPLAYVDELYALRSHIGLVRGRLTPAPRERAADG